MLARRFSMICFLTALLGIYAAIQAAEIDPPRQPGTLCDYDQLHSCEKP